MKTNIYTLIDSTTGQIRYVGKTNDLKRRLRAHCNPARFKKTHKFNWIKKLREQGLKPQIQLLEEVDMSKWKEREQWWISTLREQGCDLTNCGEGGEGLTFGNQTSFKKGHKSWTGKKLSDEHRKRISENSANRGKPASNRRAIIQLDMDGNLIARYDYIHAAARKTNSSPSKIVACCKGRRNHHNNYKWEYEQKS